MEIDGDEKEKRDAMNAPLPRMIRYPAGMT